MPDKQRVRSFILGGLAGLAAGILFAPRSGRETRGTLADRIWEVRERGRERYLEAQERLRERRAREEASPRASGEDLPRRDPRADELRARVRELRERLRERPEEPRDLGGGEGGGPA